MDPPIVNEASFSMANPSSYSLAEIWTSPTNGGGEQTGGGLGLRMESLSGFEEPFLNQDVSIDESTVTEQSGSRCARGGGGRKRRDTNSEGDSSQLVSTSSGEDLNNVSYGKRTKVSGLRDENVGSKVEVGAWSGTGNKPGGRGSKPAEPPKDYIHVRARRGQATDSHSLAERARREKISERMKILQDLVPGCNKVIGKALVLDEIINYIQSLQHQVEFLSMKLEAVNSRMNSTMEGFPPEDVVMPTFDTTGVIYGLQAPKEYAEASQPKWLRLRVGGSLEGAT